MNLLCIEDNVQLIDSLRQFLASGSSITHAATGKEGLHLAGSKKYDAVILDLGLPDISGLEVCQGIRTINSRIPLLILSGSK